MPWQNIIVRVEARLEADYHLPPMDSGTCRRCHQPIIFSLVLSRWFHANPDFNRGCRAASFRPGEGWNDELPRSWQAAPLR